MQQKRTNLQKISGLKKFCLCIIVGLFLSLILSYADQPGVIQKETSDPDSWKESIIKTRQQKDEEFKNSPTSPMAGVKRLSVKPASETFIDEYDGDITLSGMKTPKTKFSLAKKEDKWHWQAFSSDVACSLGDTGIKPGASLPDRALFKVGRLTLSAYPAEGDLTLLVFDPERPELKKFSGLFYFAPDREFAAPAKIERLLGLRVMKVNMLTSRNLEKTFFRYAQIHFELKGKPLTLTAFKYKLEGPGSEILFIPFIDKTSGLESYAGGRFLEIQEAIGDTFILDFNLCFDPLCNYSPIYNCPLPPRENFLDIAVVAGEKTYPH